MLFSILLINLAWIQCGFGNSRVDPLVNTPLGLIRGLKATDGDYSMFMGIPFATVNESNPFGESIPCPRFKGIFNAYDDSAICPQIDDTGAIVGKLDCLHLNIYVPSSASSSHPLPVLVFIYGGNFERGTAGRYLYGPKYLVRHDVILVTVSHRVGTYGFMCLDIPEVPGNQGFKDQLAGLRWVNENIEAFGGDVTKITLFGESAGARAVDLLLLSQHENLFRNVILQSGTSLVRDTIFEADTSVPIRLSQHLGFQTDILINALSYLATVEPDIVLAAAKELNTITKPCVEKPFDGVNRFISEHPVNSRIPKVRDMSIMIGYNDNEQMARYAQQNSQFITNTRVIYDRLKANFNFNDETLTAMEKLVQHFYLGEAEVSEKVLQEIVDFDTDFTYGHPTERSIRMYLDGGEGNIYYYIFSYSGNRNYIKYATNVTVGGASHADELGYLFNMSILNEPGPDEQLIMDRLTTMWTNFAKYDNPTPVTTELLPVKWTPLSSETYNYLNITTDISVMKRPFSKRKAFWDLFYQLNWMAQKGYQEVSTF